LSPSSSLSLSLSPSLLLLLPPLLLLPLLSELSSLLLLLSAFMVDLIAAAASSGCGHDYQPSARKRAARLHNLILRNNGVARLQLQNVNAPSESVLEFRLLSRDKGIGG
jgi:hypothetical protein